MASPKSTPNGHRNGAWFTTHAPEKSSFPDLSGAGVSSPSETIFILALASVCAVIVSTYRYIARKNRSAENWGTYRGLVYCQIYKDNLRFFTTLRGTSRAVVKPPSIERDLTTLTKFRWYNSTPPKVAFTFSDGFEVELYCSSSTRDLTEFRETLNSITSLT